MTMSCRFSATILLSVFFYSSLAGSYAARICTQHSTNGQSGTNCSSSESLPLIVLPTASSSILISVIIIVIIILYIRRMRFMTDLYNIHWIVQFKDIVTNEQSNAIASSSFRSMSSFHQRSSRSTRCIHGTWKGTPVVVKKIKTETSIPLNTPLRLEIKGMRDVRHRNLTKFIGASYEAPNVCILMELAPKGSLKDLLAMEIFKLDWNFRYSLLKDICQGMIYLSKTMFKSHGRLKPSNCVIDNKWTLKITDYGSRLFKGIPRSKSNDQDFAEEGILDTDLKTTLLYTAPEILATGITHPDQVGTGTIEGDVYSYSLIMYELLTKKTAFGEFASYMRIEEILSCLVGLKPVPKMVWQDSNIVKESPAYLRPRPPNDEDSIGYVELMKACWSQSVEDRPKFKFILKQLKLLHSHKSPPASRDGDVSANDDLVKMLEQYSTNLEAIVAERTAKLNAEKEKMENLICRMLPQAIAEQLEQGQRVKAELFDCVTIYFSDIVGFTSIACISTPLQVVELLNDLYTCFDDIIDDYDVYKVETIGDAYMVVSGLPVRNEEKHAGEIASMSLHLLSEILNFKIRHLPEMKLQLRIGIHSGPCVAGVVGLKMPRYCLFGDTVNTASRMESGGYALRIHLSESTAVILERLGGYQLELRGEYDVKGKGKMTTYWLKGKEGCSRPLPTDDMAVSLSQHEFK